MSIAETLADGPARERILAMERLGKDRHLSDVVMVPGASSTPLQDAFLTLIRVFRAEQRGGLFLKGTLRAGETGTPPPAARRAPDAGQ
ncbi:MAG: hypothetical protein INF93_05335 [Rhodobacter sp.]|nr:hypothetical protein [Rhodobacter sp.]